MYYQLQQAAQKEEYRSETIQAILLQIWLAGCGFSCGFSCGLKDNVRTEKY
jgi:hypothetical protein